MNKFLLKLFLFTLPFTIPLVVYIIKDPFKVLYKYDSYYNVDDGNLLILNKDYVSMENFLKNFPRYKYDSYIFGSSRSIYYKVSDWSKYVQGSHYHFDGWGESIYGIERKVAFLDEKNVEIKNALIIVDHETLSGATNSNEYLFTKHPILSGEKQLDFQVKFIKAFYDTHFLKAYFDYLLSGHKKYMHEWLPNEVIRYNSASNEFMHPAMDSFVRANPTAYYQKKASIFYARPATQQYSPVAIKKEQEAMLNNIKSIFAKNGTKYKIVVSPLYDQKKLPAPDLDLLTKIFGAENVYDFSGINSYTNPVTNYYEISHYRPHVAASILDSIYKNETLAHSKQ